MEKFKKILEDVREKGDKKAMVREAEYISETMCYAIDEAPYMLALEDGAAALAAMYALCVEDGINTVGEFLELKERLDSLIDDMHDKMREKYPVPARAVSKGQSDPDVLEALKRMRAISSKEWRNHNDLDG